MSSISYECEVTTKFNALTELINSPHPDGASYVRARGEFDDKVRDLSDWVAAAPVWHFYWVCLWELTHGLDLFMQRTLALEYFGGSSTSTEVYNETYGEPYGYNFFNERAGYKDVRRSPYAYAALRDELNISDTDRFPTSKYGSSNANRFTSILSEMSAFGAKNDDPSVQETTTFWTYMSSVSALNDATINSYNGNYGRYLDQIEPNVTDQGYWRVGSKDDPYGRFARGFDITNNKTALYFDLNDEFFALDSSEAKSVKLRVIYYDGNGSYSKWALQYHATDGTMKTAMSVTQTGTGKWITKEVELTDALLENGGDKGADLILINKGLEDCIFHMVDLERL